MKQFFLVLAPLLFTISIQDLAAQPLLRINEFMASNVTTIFDPEFNNSSDWIELHNSSSSTIDLGGYTLTDDLLQPARWSIPMGTTIPSNGYLLFWADGSNTGLHTNFKLSSEGEEIGLFDPDGAAVDAVIFNAQTADVSFGRLGSGPNVWRYLDSSTPGEANSSNGFTGFTQPVEFSAPGGFYPAAFTVTLQSNNAQAEIRYTADGSAPTESAALYTGPFSVPDTRVVRAAAFQTDHLPSPIASQTYFIDETTDLPVVSLGMDPKHLWDDELGIYVAGTNGITGNCVSEPRNWNQDWEYPASIEVFESDKNRVINQVVGVSIFGGCSRQYDQKSLAVHARNRYGKGKLKYKFFEDRKLDEFDALVLRSSGQDWFRTMFRDGMIQTLIFNAGADIDLQAYRPAILFLNGEYWGIHNIREKMNAAYIDGHYGYNEDEIDFLKSRAFAIRGDNEHYNDLIDFVSSNDMARSENYAVVNTLMDINNYLDYVATEIYIANADWPSGNNKYWRPRTPTGKWRWMIFDTDLSFGGNSQGKFFSNTLQQATEPNGPDWPNPPWSTQLLRSLLDNQQFENQFIQRIASHINITFDSTYVHHVIDSLQTKIANEVPRHKARWSKSIGFNTPWPVHIELLTEFPLERPEHLRTHVIDQFSLDGMATLEVETNLPEAGKVYVSGVAIRNTPFSGEYFQDVPIILKAKPNPGYRFVNWMGGVSSSADSVSIQITSSSSITASFEPTEPVSNEGWESGFTFNLGQNFPNPVSTLTNIPFEIPQNTHVTLRVFDILGREVHTLVHGPKTAGAHNVTINTSSLAAGLYFYELHAGPFTDRKKFVVVK